jgi:hypothetical protein
MRMLDSSRFMIFPVTKFEDREFDELDLSETEKELFLPIFPNKKDVLNRLPISTSPPWKSQGAYQMIQTVQFSGLRLERDDHVTYRCEDNDFKRLLSLLAGWAGENQVHTPSISANTATKSISTNTPRGSNLFATASPFVPRNMSLQTPTNDAYANTPAIRRTNEPHTPVHMTFFPLYSSPGKSKLDFH